MHGVCRRSFCDREGADRNQAEEEEAAYRALYHTLERFQHVKGFQLEKLDRRRLQLGQRPQGLMFGLAVRDGMVLTRGRYRHPPQGVRNDGKTMFPRILSHKYSGTKGSMRSA